MLEYRRDPRALIRERSSVRSFRAQPLPAARRAALEAACGQLQLGPLGTPCRFRLLDRKAWNPKAPGGPRGERLGTYGVIRGAPTYLAGAAVRGELALVDFGYLFELLVLKATDLGLGTCWLGGTLRRAGFGRALELREDELLPAVSPVGIPAERRSVIDRLFRLGARSSLRRRWETLFLDESGRALSPGQAPGAYREALESLRLAPSASNRQPWRGLLCGTQRLGRELHLFLCRTPGYRQAGAIDLQRMDMGIAMAHFQLGLEAAAPAEAGRGRWQVLAPEPRLPELHLPGPQARGPGPARSTFQNLEYVVSWRPDG